MLDKNIAAVALKIVAAIKRYYAENPRYSDREYCEHGTYIGTWCGPDYICGYCEDGISPYAYALGMAYVRADNAKRR